MSVISAFLFLMRRFSSTTQTLVMKLHFGPAGLAEVLLRLRVIAESLLSV